MANEKVSFVLPEGRLVMGSPFELQTKDHQGRPKDNPNYFIGVACPKTEPGTMDAVNKIYQVACRDFPGNQFVAAGPFPGDNFAWKIEDGDAPGNAGKEGYAGCIIFKFTRGGSIGPCRVVDPAHQDVLDPNMIRRGYYLIVAGSTSGNGQTGTQAGVYLNMDMIKFTRQGQEIFVGPSPDQLFGNPTGQAMPQGGVQQPGFTPTAGAGFGQSAPGTQFAPAGAAMGQTGTGFAPNAAAGTGNPNVPQGVTMPAGQPMPGGVVQPGFPQGGATPMGAPGQAPMTAPMQAPGGFAQAQGAPATGYPSDPQQGFMQTPPAGTPGANVSTGLPQNFGDPNAANAAAHAGMNPAQGGMIGGSATASPSNPQQLAQQGVQPQPGFLMPGAQQ